MTLPQQDRADSPALARLVRQAFPRARCVLVEPAAARRLIVVYRAVVDDRVFYLRLAEEPGQDLTTDARILDRLRSLGVSAPAVVAAQPAPAQGQRSYMIMAEVPGQALACSGTEDEARAAARAAGRDCAIINSLSVTGFGFLQRTGAGQLTAELPSYAEFVVSYLPERWPGWLGGLFAASQLAAFEALAAAEQSRPVGSAHLAHGDLDVTHIYADDGRYTGIIDFGEMRGAELYFDLGHFLLHDTETRPLPLFEWFLAGYGEVTRLRGDYREAIRVSAILLGLRQLSLWLSPRRRYSPLHPLVCRRIADLSQLLDRTSPRSPEAGHG
jgi:aminoglycoside phosphotransferase (APT) family kinase protein